MWAGALESQFGSTNSQRGLIARYVYFGSVSVVQRFIGVLFKNISAERKPFLNTDAGDSFHQCFPDTFTASVIRNVFVFVQTEGTDCLSDSVGNPAPTPEALLPGNKALVLHTTPRLHEYQRRFLASVSLLLP